MCGRYWIDVEEDDTYTSVQGIKTSGEVLPGDTVPVICFSRGGNIKPFAMQWGWTMSDGKKLINARSETAAQKRMFSASLNDRRCLMPMKAYYEWEKRGRDKIKYRIAPEKEGVYYLAGLYRWENTGTACTVLTRDAVEEIGFIHPRMPVILGSERAEAYLKGAALNELTPYPMDFRLG